MQQVRDQIRSFAPSDIPVLLVGPTGSGKELAARALHALSGRTGAFVPINTAVLTPELVESALFGHHRGAFTGATEDKPGAFRAADRGTLFLDEINSARMGLQGALLRTLDGGTVRPVGSDREYAVDARVVAASNGNLDRACQQGEFRIDLLYRLRGVLIRLPSLAERRDDIPELATHLLAEMTPGLRLTDCALAALRDAAWPGNVRQLRQELRVARVRAGGSTIDGRLVSDIHAQMTLEEGPPSEQLHAALISVLRATEGDIEETSRRLRRSRATVYRWCRAAGVSPRDFRRPVVAVAHPALSMLGVPGGHSVPLPRDVTVGAAPLN
jgi:DNA-binding NtrC family response regulator